MNGFLRVYPGKDWMKNCHSLLRSGFITLDHGCAQGADRLESGSSFIGCEHIKKLQRSPWPSDGVII
jgi:hypothetical protein